MPPVQWQQCCSERALPKMKCQASPNADVQGKYFYDTFCKNNLILEKGLFTAVLRCLDDITNTWADGGNCEKMAVYGAEIVWEKKNSSFQSYTAPVHTSFSQLHPIWLKRNNVFWGLVLFLKFFEILTSFCSLSVPYLSKKTFHLHHIHRNGATNVCFIEST